LISQFIGGFKSPLQLDLIEYLTAKAMAGDGQAEKLLGSM